MTDDTAKTTVAVIGLGIMGGPMAANLVTAGFDVVGHNRSRAKVDRLVAAGGRGADSVAAAVRGADVVLTMLPDSPDVRAVVLGPDGVLAHARPGVLLADCSTIRPDVAREVAEAAAEQGVQAVDAPVSGGEQGAIDGTLSVMVGGAPEAFAAAQPVLTTVGGTVVHVGGPGAGQTVKAANQLVVGGTIALVAEALTFLQAHHVDVPAALEALGGGLAGSRVLDRKAAAMATGRFTPGFRVALHHKDLGIVQDAAREVGVALPVGALVAQLMAALNAQGHGDLDHGALALLVNQLSGR